ncbi:MAG: hypothetical protein QF569_28540 [Candidatus Poribacteria bacterium]|nr:hypothetical protein [Candidatus Poribacteria bacterium]
MITISLKVLVVRGKTFRFFIPIEQLSGKVGQGITSGTDKKIVWTIAKNRQNFVIRVLADNGVEAKAGERITWQKDGSEMVKEYETAIEDAEIT